MREKASGMVAIFVLVIAVLWCAALAVTVTSGTIDAIQFVDANEEPHLRLIWQLLAWFSMEGAVPKLFAGFVAILGVAAQMLANLHKRAWTVVAVAFLCLVGLFSTVVLIASLSEPGGEAIGAIRAAVAAEEDTVASSIKIFLGSLIVWYIGFMAVQLGINIKQPSAAFYQAIRKLFA